MIKNNTIYKGKPYLTFEKYPEYRGSSKLNKVHLDLGFTKLVSRIKIDRTVPYDPEKIILINAYTGGVIGKYEWWDVQGVSGSFRSTQKPKEDKDILFHGEIEECFITKDGRFIGDADRAWWYYQEQMVVCRDYPLGVAIKIKKDMYDYVPDNHYNTEADPTTIEGYYGYTHRGGQMFKLGDRLFEEAYVPVEEDYEDCGWAGYELKYQEFLNKADGLDLKWDNGIADVIPFNRRGKVTIKTWDQAKQAAINISKYLG